LATERRVRQSVLMGAREEFPDSPIIMLAAVLNNCEVEQEWAKRIPFRVADRQQLGCQCPPYGI
jgi:hypothetical protein